jgi:hypothetical protein
MNSVETTKSRKDPSSGKVCGPVCFVWFSESGTITWLVYGDRRRSIRTYTPGHVDGRVLGSSPRFCDDVRVLAEHCQNGESYFVVPVETTKRLAGPDRVFATPDEYPDSY